MNDQEFLGLAKGLLKIIILQQQAIESQGRQHSHHYGAILALARAAGCELDDPPAASEPASSAADAIAELERLFKLGGDKAE